MQEDTQTKEEKKTFDKAKLYSIEEAVDIVKKNAHEKFDATIEIHLNLNIDPKQTDQQIRSTVTLPHPFGKTKKIIAFVTPNKEKEAREAGAEIVGTAEVIDEIKQKGKIDFEVAIAMPEMMKNLAVIAKVLGPKGLMPSPKNDTVTTNLAKTITEIKKGKTAYKNDDTSNVHVAIGKLSLDNKKIIENYNEFIDSFKKKKPASSKGIFIKRISICSSMGETVKIEVPK